MDRDRRDIILAAIIETFIKHARPVGSEHLLEEFKLHVSSATVRNDMMWLEQQGLITHPFTSAGRIPTDLGLRKFVDEMLDEFQFTVPVKYSHKLKEIDELKNTIEQQKVRSKVREGVAMLAELTDNVSFATLPWLGEVYYLGLSHVLRKPEFGDLQKVSTVIEMLEDRDNLYKLLDRMKLDENIKVFIGRENIIEAIQSCTLIAVTYTLKKRYTGVIGILGPMRMQYSRNIAVLDAVRKNLQH